MRGEDLERLEVGLLEGQPVDPIGDVQDAARDIVHHHRDRDERRGAVLPAADRHRRIVRAADEQRLLRADDVTDDALARAHTRGAHDVLRETGRARDDEIARLVIAQQERRAFAAYELGGDTKDRIEQILRSTVLHDLAQDSLSLRREQWGPGIRPLPCCYSAESG